MILFPFIEVDSKIYNELKNDDWDLLVAHYLGVDHAGHRYGPNHPEMARKLNETNSRLRKIIEFLPLDALLYVVGDHGMTESGKSILLYFRINICCILLWCLICYVWTKTYLIVTSFQKYRMKMNVLSFAL